MGARNSLGHQSKQCLHRYASEVKAKRYVQLSGLLMSSDVKRKRMYASAGESSDSESTAETVLKLSVLSAVLPLSVTSNAQAAIPR